MGRERKILKELLRMVFKFVSSWYLFIFRKFVVVCFFVIVYFFISNKLFCI